MRWLCLLGLHLRRELVVEPSGDIDDPVFVPWWTCVCGKREMF